MTFDQMLRSLEVIAARRPGSFSGETTLTEVVGRDGIGPVTFYKMLQARFRKSKEDLDLIDVHNGEMTLAELYEALTN